MTERRKRKLNKEEGTYSQYIPTPEEIKEGCRKIQEEWSSEEEQRRHTYNPDVSVDFSRGKRFLAQYDR